MKKNRIKTTFELVLVILILVVANLLSERFFTRVDLTKEQRYSVSDVSIDLVRDLSSSVLVSVYFTGEMPTRYKELEASIENYLNELRIYSKGNIEYEFIDPSGKKEIFDQFYKSGYTPFQITEQVSATEQKDKFLLPYAIVNYQGKTTIINLVRGCVFPNRRGAMEISVEKAIANFEYNLVTTLFNLSRTQNKLIGFLQGQGEYLPEDMGEWLTELTNYYTIIDVNVGAGQEISPSIDVLVVARPDTAFSERALYEIDQYLMRGGKVLWMLDNEIIDFDLGAQASTLTQLRDLNLDYLFFKWGIKVNYDIIQDAYCSRIDVASPNQTFGPQIQSRPWVFHPQIERFPPHPTTRNLDGVLIRFGASIDTTHIPGIEKKVILSSSKRSRTVQGNQFIDVNEHFSKPIPPKLFNNGPFILGMIMKGTFVSAFKDREPPTDAFAPNLPEAVKLPVNVDTNVPKIAIISDGELSTGQLYQGKKRGIPMDNKAFLMNIIDYLSGDEVLSRVRAKEVVLRTLDKEKIRGQEGFIRVFNILVPVLLILLFGFIRNYLRKRKNKQFQIADS